ncbi:hypothetical protein GE09DRAFT_1218587 [Coniochaeta sp. 2T2.1]|nr:hypothetical protein GE09DRAFT_1218587 [Coniochaeta sp. 2T2.1]
MSYSMDHPATGYDAPPPPYSLHDPLSASSSEQRGAPIRQRRLTVQNWSSMEELAEHRRLTEYRRPGPRTTLQTLGRTVRHAARTAQRVVFTNDWREDESDSDDEGRASLGNTGPRLARYIVSYKGNGEATTTMTARSFFFGPESDDEDDDDTSDENATHRPATFTVSADDVRLFNSINPWRKGIRIVPPTSAEISLSTTSARHELTMRWNLYGDPTGRGVVLGQIKVCLQASGRDWLKGLRRQDVANLITMATAVMVEGDKYTWPEGYGRPPVARRADVKYLKGFWIHPIIGGAAVVDDPEFNGIVNVSFERMLRY